MLSSLTRRVSGYSRRSSTAPRKRILILLSDTGGGHRASAGAIQDALTHLYGADNIEIIILDIWTDYGRWPFNSFVSVYRFASENPWCWKMMYESSRSPISRSLFLSSGYAVSGGNFASIFAELRPDLVISVHPLCQHVPLQIMEELHQQINYTAPFVTIVTDLGGCHPTWFHPKATRIYVPSKSVMDLAFAEGIREDQLRLFGLPLRSAFWSFPAKTRDEYREQAGFATGYRTCLVVGGGEGVGGIDEVAANIAQVFLEEDKEIVRKVKALGSNRLDASIHTIGEGIRKRMQVVVICGKNEQTRCKVLSRLRQIQAKHGASQVSVDDRSKRYEGPGAINSTRGRALSDLDLQAAAEPKKTPAQKAWNEISRVIFGVVPPVEDDKELSLVGSWKDKRTKLLSGDSSEADVSHETTQTKRTSYNRHRSMSDDCIAMKKLMDRYRDEMGDVPSIPFPARPGDRPPLEGCQPLRLGGVSTAPACDSTSQRDLSANEPLDTDAHSDDSTDATEGTPARFASIGAKPTAAELSESRLRLTVFGFSNNIDEIMAASDLIVTKAGPGTIAEAMTRGLPILLSSYMPGQEEGNVSFVLEGNFGAYCVEPKMIGVIVREWLTNPRFEGKLINMGKRSRAAANPTASIDIARDLGSFLNLSVVAPSD
eukprot:Gregarina_sp_Poly_1__9226@NODE_569_length_7491_cov_137_215517_g446_i0_p1_GENE_NODE_569_length_7491_cov_137_215517_g446_i0NODE_569_length_7491_cov_137_215517_g446_i0_p1_ORF_typecomplete_len657_score71_51MGDG_synth/PF06925_11/9_7e43Glyco_tran_28_C/PF04101_16/0_11Glyco_tran_28_C/PF04101_16/1_6e14Glyco_trans_1_4/PF13692_6/1_1e04Glyco_trans_1_4/PF13692_6/5_7e03Glyco_trans_1_4/PF13692_6/0_00032Glyco_trans_1_3/PF13528_6/1_9e02Glyco_trans_1_3/PF13528_6/0_0051Glycos_transf_1/PF00534_20/0_086_NODE_569_len